MTQVQLAKFVLNIKTVIKTVNILYLYLIALALQIYEIISIQ